MDDIIITGCSVKEVEKLITTTSQQFAIKNLGELNFFLGVEIRHTKDCLWLSQKQYIIDILKKTNMLAAKPIATSMASTPTLKDFWKIT